MDCVYFAPGSFPYLCEHELVLSVRAWANQVTHIQLRLAKWYELARLQLNLHFAETKLISAHKQRTAATLAR